MDIGELVAGGALWLALPIAFAAGVVAFLSPCVLPLAPGYVSYITGLTGAELADRGGRPGRVLAGVARDEPTSFGTTTRALAALLGVAADPRWQGVDLVGR